jgi:hypothetical protein
LRYRARRGREAAVSLEVLCDLAVIRHAAGDRDGARQALDRALALNPKLAQQAPADPDLAGLR